MRARKESVEFIERQFDRTEDSKEKYGKWHYGLHELKELMDFVYEQEPQSDEEKL